VNYLISLGVDMNKSDHNGMTPFYVTCYSGNLELVRYLISQGVDINIATNNNAATHFYIECQEGDALSLDDHHCINNNHPLCYMFFLG
jgi:ankyrin repeat protein